MFQIANEANKAKRDRSKKSTIENYGLVRDFILRLAREGVKSTTLKELTEMYKNCGLPQCNLVTLCDLLEKDEFHIHRETVYWKYK